MEKRIFNAIAGRLSLRPPQEESLRTLAQALDAAPDILEKKRDIDSILQTLSAEFPSLTDFDREFPSLCFALATGVGKTRLMGAFISYLHLAHSIKNFFVLAPNLTIYNKLIQDFTPNNPKYVFKGIAEFSTYHPNIVTGNDYETALTDDTLTPVTINIFNISKINSEVRGGKSPRIKRLRETIGDSYFNYLSSLPDLVMLMDESHRYRASQGVRALNELNPLLGLELTATPYTESNQGPVPFNNIVVDYPLARAMDDGFVKEPAVVTQRNFNPDQFSKEKLELIKLEDGIRLHESTKAELQTYAKQENVPPVKPFILVVASDTAHATKIIELIENQLFEGKYRGKVIQVDSNNREEETVNRLLAVESSEEPTEIVIHVNMLKEGWDVTNLYTIIPLRSANAKTLVEQTVGRGLRLPYGERTGVDAVDRLSIVAHDRFQEIVDEANTPDSQLRQFKFIETDFKTEGNKESVTIKSKLELAFSEGYSDERSNLGSEKLGSVPYASSDEATLIGGEQERRIAELAWQTIQEFQQKPNEAPTAESLRSDAIQKEIVRRVSEKMTGSQQKLIEEGEDIEIAAVVSRATQIVVQQTIDIPQISVLPKGNVIHGYNAFSLDIGNMNLQPANRELISQSLQTNQQISISSQPIKRCDRLEDYIVEHLVNENDISYDDHADLLYNLATQAVDFFRETHEYSEDELHNIFFGYGKQLAENIHEQMQDNSWEEASDGYEISVTSGFTPLKDAAYTKAKDQEMHNFRDTVQETGKIRQILFDGFKKCLYRAQKFDSDTERRFAIILERDSIKWFKPVIGQFQISYKVGAEHKDYFPDFVAELDNVVLMVETKAQNDMKSDVVLAKAEAAREWCSHASKHLREHGGKEWKYLLIPHNAVNEQTTLDNYVKQFAKHDAD